MDQTILDNILGYYRDYCRDALAAVAQGSEEAVYIDCGELLRYDSGLVDDLVEKPDTVLEYFEEAVQQYDMPVPMPSDVPVRPTNLDETRCRLVGEYARRDLGELLTITGQVARLTDVRPRVEVAAFECQRCGTIQDIPQTDQQVLQEPGECRGCERQGPYRPDLSNSEMVNSQLARLQLPPEEAAVANDSKIDIRIERDLCGQVSPGDRVAVTAILDADFETENGQQQQYLSFHADALSVEITETDFESVETDPYEDRVRDLVADDPYETITDAIAPSLEGLDTIKLAVALQMFGGVRKPLESGVLRGDSHILMVGDPGVGKSQILGYVDDVAPRSVFSDGKGSTSAGLTASAVRDDWGGDEWTIKGGTIVKAHNGVACIDELDDMDEEDRSSLHTALEKQEVPVAKAGINATLPAQTTLLAAANPKHGRFDKYEPIPQQIEINPALVSRFDLIFTLTDRVDEERDARIIEHKADMAEAGQLVAAGEDLPEDLRETAEPPVESDVLTAWVALGKQTVPRFDPDAKQLLKDEFACLRKLNKNDEKDPEEQPIPVTFRKQEAVTRIAEASARVRLSETITEGDVERALRLVKRSMRDVDMDPDTGDFDVARTEAGTTMSLEERKDEIQQIIAEAETPHGMGVPEDDVIAAAKDHNMTERQITDALEKLQQQGRIYTNDGDKHRTT